MAWEKKPAIENKIVSCPHCGPNHHAFPLNEIFAVGFGSSGITKDDQCVYDEQETEGDNYPALQKFEDMAAADPDHDWRLYRHGPMKGEVYQRHETGLWVLIEEDRGFA